jgi:hypothetical protein
MSIIWLLKFAGRFAPALERLQRIELKEWRTHGVNSAIKIVAQHMKMSKEH